ncbi:MAG TPA: 2-amino-4-hydroxy-6-hydroxymethyldihydropteridine diphosphokinase [Polyangiaceae bacterium]|jgi:2-amino-4-hydroxy-6-hydroxymethyldihydropteridine diphosphokinase|nr:2-amino-4-hydroxy-6-hydroxymethyldihydropteridine diphosphokinase [Polyangiaceae bacterium]
MDVVVGIGGNLGDRRALLGSAITALQGLGAVTAVSRLYETPPFGPPQPDYLNAAARMDVALQPLAFLEALLDIERRHGRIRRERWGPRTLDLDILWIARTVVEEDALTVPHPRLSERRFALLPLLDVAPGATHPSTGEAFRDWVAALPADDGIRVIAGAEWLADGTAGTALPLNDDVEIRAEFKPV